MRISSIFRLAVISFEIFSPLSFCRLSNAQIPLEGTADAKSVSSFANYRDLLHDSRNPYVLLHKKEIQKELSVTNDTMNKIEDIEKRFKDNITKLLSELKRNKGDLEGPAFKLMRKEVLEYRNQSIKNVLSKSQFVRLWQIALQIEGPMALAWPEFCDRFRVTEFQLQQILEVTEDCNKKLMNINWEIQSAYNKMQNQFNLEDSGKRFEDQLYSALKNNKTQFKDLLSKKTDIYNDSNKKALKFINGFQVRSINKFIGETIDVDEFAAPGSAVANSIATKMLKKQ